jgi:hypothetical protein
MLAGLVGLAACSDEHPTDLRVDSTEPGSPLFNSHATGDGFVPGQIIVRFRPGAARAEIAQANRATHKRDMQLDRMVILAVPVGEELAIARNLARNPNVEFAEPDWVYSVILPCDLGDCTAPAGDLFGFKWDLHNRGVIINQFGQEVMPTGKKGADIAWLEAREHLGADFGGTAVIGILDTGIRKTHVALAGKVIGERNFIVDMDPTLANDDQGHGTHVAAIAAARGSARAPGVGYGENIKLLSLKVCNSAGQCPSSGTADAIVWAADNGANVLNLSLGGGWNSPVGSAAQQAAFQYAESKNVISFCATGNDATRAEYTVGIAWPARFPECVAVGSTDWRDARAPYSNFGPGIELTAPGGTSESWPSGSSYLLAAVFNNDGAYGWKTGTSMAAPQAAGLAALMYATGITDAQEIRRRMHATADDRGAAGWDEHFGHGRINVYRALTGTDPVIAMTISTRSTVRLAPRGSLQVVVLDREATTFGLDMIRLETIRLGRTVIATRQNGTPSAVWSDVDGDGRLDLVLQFDMETLQANGDLTATTTELVLTGTIDDGRQMRGAVGIKVTQARR